MIESLPDLAVLRPDLMIQRTRPGGPPDSLSVATAVRKHELVDAAGGLLEVQNGSGELLTSQPLAVAANGQSTITALWMPRDVNWDTLIVVVNPNAAFLEQRTDNDTLRIELNPSTVSVADHQALTLSLAQSRPNPMRRDVLVQFSLPEPANVKLSVYDVAGREVRMILAGFLNAGIHSVRWDGSGKDGQPAAAGVYFYRLRVGGQALARRLVILR